MAPQMTVRSPDQLSNERKTDDRGGQQTPTFHHYMMIYDL